MKKVSILGESGVTGQAIKEALKHLPDHIQVPPEDADLIITSPGIPPDQYQQYRKPVISEIEFTQNILNLNLNLIAITGTNGKTTTTEMIAHILKIPAMGNIGDPFINILRNPSPSKAIALELSSYQLETSPTFRPKIAIITNITPDHLERHKTMEEYIRCKSKITENQTSEDTLIYNADCPHAAKIANNSSAKTVPITEALAIETFPDLAGKKGPHNAWNALAAINAAKVLNHSESVARAALNTYTWPEHRMEHVASKLKDITIINDSKSTNPDATLKALATTGKDTHLILCGDDKKIDLDPFIKSLKDQVKTITVFGDLAPIIQKIVSQIPTPLPISYTKTMTEALDQITKMLSPGEAILFSPSSSSFDQYPNYKVRGDAFKTHVQNLA